MKVYQFLQNNYKELFLKIEYDSLVDELPIAMKEALMYHQYGPLMNRFDFFETTSNNLFVWDMLKKLSKIQYEKGDVLYEDNS